jgi:uncharacterized YigZ family protein
MNGSTYNTIEKPAHAEFKDRGSKFLAYAFPIRDVDQFKSHLSEIKKEHPKASHHCFAYRLGTDGLQYRASDAGEPAGSAGKPILGQIDRMGLTDVLVIVVRYFSGTLLGIPGLIHAYKSAAALSLQMTPVIVRNIERRYRFSFDYTVMSAVMQVIRDHHCTVYRQDSQLFSVMEAGIPLKYEEICLNKLRNIKNMEIMPVL